MLWIGTPDGLNVIDGSVLKKIYHKAGDTTSLQANDIFSLAEDSAGNIWVGSGGGLCCYVKTKKAFFSVPLPASIYGASNIVSGICIINTKQLWCATEGGLFLYDIPNKKSTPYFNTVSLGKDNHRYGNMIHKMINDHEKNLWLCTSDGFWKFNTSDKSFKKINGKPGTPYHPLCMVAFESSDNKIWFGTWQYGLHQADKTTDSVIGYSQLPGFAENVSSITEIPGTDGRYLLLLNGNMKAFDPFTNRFIQLPKPTGLLDYPTISTATNSSDGWLWLGTSNDGLFVANPQAQHFKNHFFGSSITSQAVVLNEWNNQLIVGAENTSLLKVYDSSWKVAFDFYKDIYPSPLANESFATLNIENKNNSSWWIGTSAGLLRFNPNNGVKKWYTANKKDSTRLPTNFITRVYQDKDNEIWIFPWRQGIWKMDRNTGKFYKVWNGFITETGVQKKLVVADAAEDDKGNIWMADLDEGIILFEKNSGTFSKPFEKQLGVRYSAFRIYFRNGFLYSFTDNMLLKWNDKMGIQKIALPDGMNKAISDIVQDKNNNWWLAGKSGLICYNEKDNIFKRFTNGDGLVNNNLDGNLFCRNNGDIVFASSTYMSSFPPGKLLHQSNSKIETILTGISVNDSSVTPVNNAIHLTYQQNNIVFKWALPSFINPFGNQYYCQLKGIDTAWRFVGNKGEIQYANLAPGRYTILLKAATSNGIESANIVTCEFNIEPPVWQRNWFLTTTALVLAFIIFWLVRKRIVYIKRKAALQKEISDLEMKALRAQMNPHFIFNSLNSIQECIVMKDTDAAYKYLSQFSKLVRRVLENSGKATVPLTEELELMQWYLTLEKLRFTDDLNISIQKKFSDDSFEIPSMVIQPFLENALWHGLANKQGEKSIRLLVYPWKDMVNIVIEDNGIGRKASAELPKTNSQKSMGLQIAKERLRHFSYASSVEIIDMMDKDGNASGTKVIIHLPYYG